MPTEGDLGILNTEANLLTPRANQVFPEETPRFDAGGALTPTASILESVSQDPISCATLKTRRTLLSE